MTGRGVGWALCVDHLLYSSDPVTGPIEEKAMPIQTKVLLADDAICTTWISAQL